MKKCKIEYLLYLFIILSPFLDSFSFLFREFFPHAKISPTTIIRPIIPTILFMYVFIKDKKERKYLLCSAFFFLFYGGMHLYFFQKNVSTISYGNVFSEIQYLLNYTYMVYLFYLVFYFYKKGNLPYLKHSLCMMLASYVLLLYIALLTHTSYSTYLEGMGFKGWNLSGNALSTVLVLLCGGLVSFLLSSKKMLFYGLYLLTGIYLVFFIGTRTGLLGFLLVSGFYFLSFFIFTLVKKKKINKKGIFFLFFLILVVGSVFFTVGSSTLERRKHISLEEEGIIDVNTGEKGHTSGDTSLFVYQIENEYFSEDYMRIEQQNAYLKMYHFANQHQLSSNNMRMQQLLYHWFLVKEQKNIGMIFFGNGYLTSYGEMILEMEIPAIFFNFGVFGFILFLGPFLYRFYQSLKKMVQKKAFTLNRLMYLFSILLGFALSFLAGYVFFSVSCVLVMICLFCLLYEEELE